jgi:hypothetical protein
VEKITINPSGFNSDISPAELGPEVWNVVNNVIFQNGFASAAPGWLDAAPGFLCKPLYLLPVFTGASYFWLYGGNTADELAGFVGVTDGANHWDVTPAAGLGVTAAGDWTGGVLNGNPVLNNGIDEPMTWGLDTAQPCTTVPGWPANTRCEAFRPFKYHLVAMNITDNTGAYPDLVIWSDAADQGALPLEWAPTPANQAGSFTISTTTGGIVDGGEMRDQFMIYKTGSSTIIQYIAGQFVFSNRKAFVTSGILARNCWAELYGNHFVVTDGDVIRHNGQEVQSLIDGINRTFLFDQIDSDHYRGAHVVLSHSTKQLWINFPKSGHEYCDTSLVYDLTSNTFGLVNFDQDIAYMTRGILNEPGADNSFDSRTDTFDEAPDRFNSSLFNPTSDVLVFCEYEQQRAAVLDGYLRDGAPVPILLQILSKDFGHPQRLKLVNAVWPSGKRGGGRAGAGLGVRIGTQMALNDPVSWSAFQAVDTQPKADFMASGRFISLEFSGDQNTDWQLDSTDIDYELQGLW